MKSLQRIKVSFCFIGFLLFPLIAFSASQDNATGPQEKVKVTDERHIVEGAFFYLNIPDGGLLLTGSVTVKDALTGKEYKNGQNYIAYNAHAEESGFTNTIYIMLSGAEKNIEPIPQGTEILVSYEYLTKGEKDTIAEKVLEEVSSNYSKIADLSADITETSKVGEQPSKVTIRQMVRKGKDKSKLISDGSTIINDGNVTTIKETGKEPVVVNQEAYFMPSEMPEIDYHYKLTEFLTQHEVSITGRDAGNVIIEAVPNSQGRGYSKFRLVIETKSGLDLVSETYGEDGKIMLKQEILGYQNINGVYVPTKYEETLYVETGAIVTTAELSNIRLNQGVSDEEFK